MRVCVFTHTFPRFKGDPVAPFMADFCQGLIENGHNLYILAPYDRLFSQNLQNTVVNLYKYTYPTRFHLIGYSRTMIGDQKLKPYVYILAPSMIISSTLALLKLVRKNKIEVISAHWILPNGFIGAVISKITGVPLIITVPGSDVFLAKKNFLFKSMALFAANQARYIVSNSMRYLDELEQIGVKRSKFVEIPYGVDLSRFENLASERAPLRKKLQIEKSEFVILAVGRLVEKKGFEYLIQALPIILNQKKDVKLVIIGNGSEKEKLLQLTENLQVKKAVIFLGKINHHELANYYSIADVYVASSVKDRKGNLESHIVALFEAIASGLPIVATTLAVNDIFVKEQENGYRVDQKNPEELAKAIIKIINNPNRKTMGKVSKKIASEYLSYQVSGKRFDQLLSTI